MDKDILTDFAIPNSELGAEMITGDHGQLMIDVEVIGQVGDVTLFRKHNKAVPEGNFKPENAKQMRERLVKKQEKTGE